MKITKKVCLYILVGLITITGTFTSFYKGAYAFEYVGGALAFEEAIKWLLASVGIISAGGMTADYWENHSQEFEDYCIQQNITDTEVVNWQLKLCEGILDKGSDCWQAFKEWASTLTGSSSGGETVPPSGNELFNFTISANSNVSTVLSQLNSALSTSWTTVDYSDYTVYGVAIGKNTSQNRYRAFLFLSDLNFTSFSSGGTFAIKSTDNLNFNYLSFYRSDVVLNNTDSLSFVGPTNTIQAVTGNISFSDNMTTNVIGWGSGDSVDSDFISVQPDVTDLDIISSPIPDTDAQEVAIPMPGVSDSDNEASAEAYDNIVDQVNDGTLELDDAITQVIDTLKIIVYEQETDKIFPKPDNEEDQEDLDDKINQNKDNMGFTLGGLESVFPFCIPWDIYAFINLLRADPVPPKIELPFPNPLDPENPWTVEVDFSDWDDGMRIVRLAEDFLFIIGLAVLTRSLIGAGGGDG